MPTAPNSPAGSTVVHRSSADPVSPSTPCRRHAMNEPMSHVLVVDDDLRLREVLRKYLVKSGFMVTTAQDAADARAKLKSLSFDLIVLDVMMPGENGLELTESLRRENPVPILLLTARGEPD